MCHYGCIKTFHDDQWQNIRTFLERCPDVYLGRETDSWHFVEAVRWINRTEAA
jgi:hypothetical protein